MTYVKINETLYPASIGGRLQNKEWDGRASKTIELEMDYGTAIQLWVDGVKWSIVQQDTVTDMRVDENGIIMLDEFGNPIMIEDTVVTEFDNSDYNIAGPITDYRDGTIAVTMGKLTELEEAYEMLLGGME